MGNYVYYAEGTLSGEASWDDQQRDISPRGLLKLRDAIEDSIRENFNDDLAMYLRPGEGLKGIVVSIKPGVTESDNELRSWTRIETNRRLTPEEQKEVLEYLSGQFGDGWGEGFEQTSVAEDTQEVQYMEFDCDTCEFYTDYTKHHISFYVHFWQGEPYFTLGLRPVTPVCEFTGRECEYYSQEWNIRKCSCPSDNLSCLA